VKLDARTVAALDLGGKTDAIFFDEDMPGFGIRLRLGGGGKVLRTWVVQYRRAGGTRRMRLGSGEVLSAEAARKAAKKALATVELGGDPQGERADRRDKNRLTLKSQVDQYLAVKEREVRPKTLRELRRYLTGPAFKPLHGMPVDSVTRKDAAGRDHAWPRLNCCGPSTSGTIHVLCVGDADGHRGEQPHHRHHPAKWWQIT
jgi:Arm domain-containing DNA-binding protein